MNGRWAVQGCSMCQRVPVAGKARVGSVLTLAVIAISTVLTAIAVVPVVPLPIIAVTISATLVSSSRTCNHCSVERSR